MATYQSRYTGAEIDAGIAAANGAMPKNGGTMLGALMLSRDPEDEREAAHKKYVDDAIRTIELTPGPQGDAGKDGTPATHSWEGTVLTVTSASGTSSADLKGDKGEDGQAGEAGISPTVAVGTIVGGHRVTITDAEGTKSFDVMDGKDGTGGGEGGGGADGEDGATFYPAVSSDGVLSWSNNKGLTNPDPVNIKGEKGDKGDQGESGSDGVSATHSWNGTTLTITSASGTSSADLKGEKGDKGDQGEAGVDYIVDQGVTNGWLWRKWNSGIGECWTKLTKESAFTSTWGSLYEAQPIEPVNYPFTFVEIPFEFATPGNNGLGAWVERNSSTTQSTTLSGTYQLIRPAKDTKTYTLMVNLYVVGKWQ